MALRLTLGGICNISVADLRTLQAQSTTPAFPGFVPRLIIGAGTCSPLRGNAGLALRIPVYPPAPAAQGTTA